MTSELAGGGFGGLENRAAASQAAMVAGMHSLDNPRHALQLCWARQADLRTAFTLVHLVSARGTRLHFAPVASSQSRTSRRHTQPGPKDPPLYVFKGVQRIFQEVLSQLRVKPLSIELTMQIREDLATLVKLRTFTGTGDELTACIYRAAWHLLDFAQQSLNGPSPEPVIRMLPEWLEIVCGSLYPRSYTVPEISPARAYMLSGMSTLLQNRLHLVAGSYLLAHAELVGEHVIAAGGMSQEHCAAICLMAMTQTLNEMHKDLTGLADPLSFSCREAAAHAASTLPEYRLATVSVEKQSVNLFASAFASLEGQLIERFQNQDRPVRYGRAVAYEPESWLDTRMWFVQHVALEIISHTGWDRQQNDQNFAMLDAAIRAADTKFLVSTLPTFNDASRGFYAHDIARDFRRAIPEALIRTAINRTVALPALNPDFVSRFPYPALIPLMVGAIVTFHIWEAGTPYNQIPEPESADWPKVDEVWGKFEDPKTWILIIKRTQVPLQRWPILDVESFHGSLRAQPMDKILERGLQRIFPEYDPTETVEAPAQGRALQIRKGFTRKRVSD